ncbi:S1 domain-containing RNA-binding protein [Lentilactobacillus senioris]|uniref:S1 domain-containing RNA-binding protein n=1 Tax=Lentilactobacillus senioris TaxID=931534 RepID=UPI00227E002D|nr:S1 domain-containing RNA-binding protein [Lentilactobacillus senioris]MCY9807579.1 S1 domain-containing RNA-binding protein [Lentilactobacillus senioris]
MAIEVGAKVTGKVSGITNFGAFIDLGDHQTGLVHISEVSDGFVKDIHDVLSVGDEVTVKVLKAENNKISLSIRKAVGKPKEDSHPHHNGEHHDTHRDGHHDRREHNNNHSNSNRGQHNSHGNNGKQGSSFDDLMSGFLKESEDRLATLKRNTEGKRGGRGGRRS